MPTSNPWTSPFQRSFNSIKSRILTKLRERIPEITDLSEGNIFVLIISIFAGIAEVIHYYIDGMAREAFLPTCTRYTSLFKHAKLVDYHIKAAIPSTVDITIYMEDGKEFKQDIIIPQSTEFKSNDGMSWITTREIIIPKGSYTYKIPVSQKVLHNEVTFGIYDGDHTTIKIEQDSQELYVEGSMILTIGNEIWKLVNTFAYSGPGDKVYKVELDSTLKPYIVFGDGQFGRKPDYGSTINGQYFVTYGSNGNIPENSFDTVPSALTNITSGLGITNVIPARGGSNYEDFDTLKEHIPLSLKTLGVAITKEDYEAMAMLVDGVDKAYCNYLCGRYIEVYITPDGGSEASTQLLHRVNKTLEASKVIIANIRVLSTHEAKIFLSATITGKKSFKAIDISNQVKKALMDRYNYQNSDINLPVRLSDIYAIIDNQSMVDYLTIDELYVLPYPIAIVKNSSIIEEDPKAPALNITYFNMKEFESTEPETDFENFYIEPVVKNTSENINYKVYDNHNLLGTPLVGEYGKPLEVRFNSRKSRFVITINPPVGNSSYNANSLYQLTTQPMGKKGRLADIIPHNYNIPIFNQENINLKINEVV